MGVELKDEGPPVINFLNKSGVLVESVELLNKNRRECREVLLSHGFKKLDVPAAQEISPKVEDQPGPSKGKN